MNSKVTIIIFAFISISSCQDFDHQACSSGNADCIEKTFCGADSTKTELTSCGSTKICCPKEWNYLKLKAPTCGILNFDVPLSSVKLPSTASIIENGRHICLGVLINPRVVMTSTHCAAAKDLNSLKVELGVWQKQSVIQYKEERGVSKIINHPIAELSLIILDSAASDNVFVSSMCLPNQNEKFINASCILLGDDQTSSDKINTENLKVKNCANDDTICAVNTGSAKPYQGSGLICPINQKSVKSYQLAGIFVSESNNSLDFVDIAQYRTWVDDIMKDLKFSTKSYIYKPIPRVRICIGAWFLRVCFG
jgi:hypothetical protein